MGGERRHAGRGGAEPSLAALEPVDRCGRYDLLGRIATGGMAEIFLAREPLEGGGARHLVVKRVLEHIADDETFVSMFLDEARLSARLSHPNVCHVYEFGRDGDDYFLAMEWVRGVTLRDLERRAGERGLPILVALRIASEVADALSYAHRLDDDGGTPLGIVHRDVSPHNIMVSFDGAVKLLDFGIAKAHDHSTRTRTGQIKGKFAYMAPEQCMQLDVDARTDVFALGILLFEALTGRNPFKRDTDVATMRAILDTSEPPAVRELRPDVPEHVDAIVQQALAPSRADRFQTIRAMKIALDRVIAGTGEVVDATAVSGLVRGLFEKELARGPVLKRSRRHRDGSHPASGTQTARGSNPSASVESYPTSASQPSALSDAELSAIATAADAEAASLARGHVRKLAVIALLVVAVIAGGVYWVLYWGDAGATLSPRDGSESERVSTGS